MINRLSRSLLLLLAASVVHTEIAQAQPTFNECKIFLIASDIGRDHTLNQDPDYIRFLNLVARTHLIAHAFDAYDVLPIELQNNYNAYAWTSTQEVDISAAMFGAPATDDELLVLESFCNATSDLIAESIKSETGMPTWAPTSLSAAGGETDSLPQLMFDADTTAEPGPVAGTVVSELPIECRRGMFGSDTNRDGYLTPEEYVTFINRLSANTYVHVVAYADLPEELRNNFDQLKVDGAELLDVFGSIPSQWPEASRLQQQLLQLLCYRTEAAIVKAYEAKERNQTQTAAPIPSATDIPILVLPATSVPNSEVTISLPGNSSQPVNASVPSASVAPVTTSVPTSTATTNPTKSTTNTNTNTIVTTKGKNLSTHAIAAIVGSILFAMLGIYLANEKTDFFKNQLSKFKVWKANLSLRGSRIRIRPQQTKEFTRDENGTGNGATSTNPKYDIEEQTGFLEDERICALNNVIDAVLDCSTESGSSNDKSDRGGFSSVRYNPDNFIACESGAEQTATSDNESPADNERDMVQDGFLGFSFDSVAMKQKYNDDGDSKHSDDTSVYCSSIAVGNPIKPISASSVTTEKTGQLKSFMVKDSSCSTDATDVMTDISSLPLRGSTIHYQAKRFHGIAKCESNDGSRKSPQRKFRSGRRRRPGVSARRRSPHQGVENDKANLEKDEEEETGLKESTAVSTDKPQVPSEATQGTKHQKIFDSTMERLDESEVSLEGQGKLSGSQSINFDSEEHFHDLLVADNNIKPKVRDDLRGRIIAEFPKAIGEAETASSSFLETSSTSFQVSSDEDRESCTKKATHNLEFSEGDSTYEGTETGSSSFGIQSESERTDNDDRNSVSTVSEIHRLVAKVLPGDEGNVNRMLIQYKGREEELLNTLRRLEVRVDSRCAVGGRPIHVSPSMEMADIPVAHMTGMEQRRPLLQKASEISEKSRLLHGTFIPYNRCCDSVDDVDKPICNVVGGGVAVVGDGSSSNDEESSKGILNWGSSTDIDEDNFSMDSTYYETSAREDDESVSLFSR